MKKFILTFIFALISVCSFSQPMQPHFRPPFDMSKYEVVDSLPLERITLHFEKEIDNEDFIDLGSGDYLAPLPHNDKIVIRTTSDKTKAIVLYNSYCYGRHFEFNVKDNERRTILWFENKRVYCGYVYDKKYKVAKYFETKKEFKRFMKHPFFNKE